MQKQFILSKKQPTRLSQVVAPVIAEDDLLFAACGNTVKVFSIRTGYCIKTLRQAPKDSRNNSLQDVHKSDILYMSRLKNKLVTICGRGTVAEWDIGTQDLLAVFNLAVGEGRVKLCVANKRYICTYQS